MIPTGLPAKLCTPFITPLAGFPTFGPPGYAIDPRSGYTFNDIVAVLRPVRHAVAVMGHIPGAG